MSRSEKFNQQLQDVTHKISSDLSDVQQSIRTAKQKIQEVEKNISNLYVSVIAFNAKFLRNNQTRLTRIIIGQMRNVSKILWHARLYANTHVGLVITSVDNLICI